MTAQSNPFVLLMHYRLAGWIGQALYIWALVRRFKKFVLFVVKILLVILVAYLIFGSAALEVTWLLISLGFQLAFAMMFMAVQFIGLFWFLSRTKTIETRPGDRGLITFDDYFGSEHLVAFVRQWVSLLTDRRQLDELGGKAISGLLLIGPPGCGKTMLAQALSSDSKAAFIGMGGSDFQCVAKGTRITTNKGLIPIENIAPGDVVWSGWNWRPVTRHMPQGKRDGLQIRTRAGYEIVASPRHPFWTFIYHPELDPSYQGKTRNSGKHSQWVNASDIKIGDRVALSLKNSGAGQMDPLDAYILGLYIAEGSPTSHYERIGMRRDVRGKPREVWYGFSIASTDNKLKGLVSKWAESRGLNSRTTDKSVVIDSGGDWLWQYISSTDRAKSKQIPDQIMVANPETKFAFLSGMYDGDGCAEPTWGILIYSSASEQLARQTQLLLGSIGIASTLREYRCDTSFSQDTQMYEVKTSGIWTDMLQTGLRTMRMKKVSPKDDPQRARLKVAKDGFVYDVVSSIKPTHDEFYDLEVAGDHAYCANHFTTHNSMFFGVGVLKIMATFRKARAWAKEYGSCILFIDEVDAVASSRGGVQGDPRSGPMQGGMMGGMFGGGGGLGVMSRLLVEMDGIREISLRDQCHNRARSMLGLPLIDPGLVLVLAGTNRPDVLDPAITRPGRFDRKIIVGLPDRTSRRAIINGYLERVKHEDGIDVESLVADTAWASPALLASAIQKDAVRLAIFDGRDRVSQRDIEDALQENALGFQQPISDLDPDQRRQIAVHEASHALAIHKLIPQQHISRVSIVRRSAALGYVMHLSKTDIYARPLSDFTRDIMVSLAGHVGTEIVLGETWTGASGDLEAVRGRVYALAAHGYFGSFPMEGDYLAGEAVHKVVDKFLHDCMEKTGALLQANRRAVDALTDALLREDDLSGEQAVSIMETAMSTQEDSDEALRQAQDEANLPHGEEEEEGR